VIAAATADHLCLLDACWRSIGLRSATVELEFSRPVLPIGSLASQLRSALGPALATGGVRSGTLRSIPGGGRPAALWFRGWDCPPRPVRRLRAELRCVGAVAGDWPALRQALARLRLPSAGGALVDAADCSVTWWNGLDGEVFGQALPARMPTQAAGAACLVEALSPLHLTAAGRMVTGPAPLPVLVRSAGERLRQLARDWGEGAEMLPTTIGRAHRESGAARLAWAEMIRAEAIGRRSSSTGQWQTIRGVMGTFAYEGAGPLALAILALGAEVGVGKEVAFGCGNVRFSVAEVQ
jgi:hypothetical protein